MQFDKKSPALNRQTMPGSVEDINCPEGNKLTSIKNNFKKLKDGFEVGMAGSKNT